MWQRFRHWMTLLGVMTARPAAFFVFAGYTLCWFLVDRPSVDWHSVATLATWFMTLIIQRAEHRDSRRSRQSWTSYYAPTAMRGPSSPGSTTRNRSVSRSVERRSVVASDFMDASPALSLALRPSPRSKLQRADAGRPSQHWQG